MTSHVLQDIFVLLSVENDMLKIMFSINFRDRISRAYDDIVIEIFDKEHKPTTSAVNIFTVPYMCLSTCVIRTYMYNIYTSHIYVNTDCSLCPNYGRAIASEMQILSGLFMEVV